MPVNQRCSVNLFKHKVDWIGSDYHFLHDREFLFRDRNCNSQKEHDELIIKNHNSVVCKHHRIIIAGDISLGNKEKTRLLVQRLHGYKILILGNHDRGHSTQWWLDCGFKEVISFPIIYKGKYIISHEPVFIESPFINLHGHYHHHRTYPENIGLDKNKFVHIGIDDNDLKPHNLKELIREV